MIAVRVSHVQLHEPAIRERDTLIVRTGRRQARLECLDTRGGKREMLKPETGITADRWQATDVNEMDDRYLPGVKPGTGEGKSGRGPLCSPSTSPYHWSLALSCPVRRFT